MPFLLGVSLAQILHESSGKTMIISEKRNTPVIYIPFHLVSSVVWLFLTASPVYGLKMSGDEA